MPKLSPLRQLILLLLPFLIFGCQSTDNQEFMQEDVLLWVDPFIGTDGTGHTFPGPTLPFGMVQPGPDNNRSGWDYTSGYQFRDSTILGFSQTRANGTGINEFGDILILPRAEHIATGAAIKAQKTNELAEVGYYSIGLDDGDKVELTCSDRVAFHKYTFPDSVSNYLYIDFQHGLSFLTDSLVLIVRLRLLEIES